MKRARLEPTAAAAASRSVINKLGVGGRPAAQAAVKKGRGGGGGQGQQYTVKVLEGSDETIDLSAKTSQAVCRATVLLGERYTLQARRIEVVVKNKKEGGDYNYEALSFTRELHEKSPKVDNNGKELKAFEFNLPAKLNRPLFEALWTIYGPSIISLNEKLAKEMFLELYCHYGPSVGDKLKQEKEIGLVKLQKKKD